MKKIIFYFLSVICSVSFGQQQYISNFTPPSDFSDYTFSMYGPSSDVIDNAGLPRSCSFYNGKFGTPALGMYSKGNLIDYQAQSLSYSYDSLVFAFRIKTVGYAKNFRVRGEFLPNTGNFPFSLTRDYNGVDSVDVKFKVSFTTTLPFNWTIWLEKQDTTLNNFTAYLSNLDIKGYLHYGAAGLNDVSKSEDGIYWNNQAIFFSEKWINKKYWISDLSGKLIFSGIVNSTNEKLNLENGFYILHTEKSTKKMLISSY